MRILVTGAAGSVGSSLVRFFANNNHTVCALDNSEDGLFRLRKSLKLLSLDSNIRYWLGDMRDVSRIKRAIRDVNWVVHCASYKHVDILEYNPQEAINTNVIGAMNLLEASMDSDVEKVLFTSSDKAVNPTSTMGATKLLVEKLFIAGNSQVGSKNLAFSMVRFGNVLGTNGSVLKIFRDCVLNKEKCPITDLAMSRFFVTLQGSLDLCQYALDHMNGGEIYIKEMGSTSVLSLLKAYTNNPNPEYVLIGKKSGEKIYEELATLDEAERTVNKEGYYIIYPESDENNFDTQYSKHNANPSFCSSKIYSSLNS